MIEDRPKHIVWLGPLDAYQVYLRNDARYQNWQHAEMPAMGYYYQRHKFPYMMLSLLDALVYQSR